MCNSTLASPRKRVKCMEDYFMHVVQGQGLLVLSSFPDVMLLWLEIPAVRLRRVISLAKTVTPGESL